MFRHSCGTLLTINRSFRKRGFAISRLRKIYMTRLVGRCLVLAVCVWLNFDQPDCFEVLHGFGFFKRFSWLHLLWLIWVGDMVLQLIPAKQNIALGSKKLFKQYFTPSQVKQGLAALKQYIISTTKAAYKILIIWTALIVTLGILHAKGILGARGLFLISVLFYVCDLICVLFWCPFRLLLRNRCCTTCRIFNWDHIMMFTPMLFVCGFYSYSLLLLSAVVWVAWELSIILHPERFWFMSNETLRCSNCTDKLCTQYCHKLRPAKTE